MLSDSFKIFIQGWEKGDIQFLDAEIAATDFIEWEG